MLTHNTWRRLPEDDVYGDDFLCALCFYARRQVVLGWIHRPGGWTRWQWDALVRATAEHATQVHMERLGYEVVE